MFDLSTSLKNFATVLFTLAHFATPMRCHKTDSEQFFASRLFQELGNLDALFASSFYWFAKGKFCAEGSKKVILYRNLVSNYPVTTL